MGNPFRYLVIAASCFLLGHSTRGPMLLSSLNYLKSRSIAENYSQPPPTTKEQEISHVSWSPLLNENITDPWKRELYKRLDRVREKCGSLCGINDITAYSTRGFHKNGNAYSTFQAPVDCTKLFEMDEIDAGDTTVPYPIPEELVDLYSLNGSIRIANFGKKVDVYLGSQAKENIWTRDRIQNDLVQLQQGHLKGTYEDGSTNLVRDRLLQQGGLTNQTVLVVGSQRPWLETVALHVGAANVTTLEYGEIQSLHPQINTMTPDVFRQRFLAGKLPQYDAVLTFSTLEHSGLGRYGDALNPWGDILSLARCWCVTKDNGMLMLGVPVGPDSVEFNAHRVYGNIRMPLITTNWMPSDSTKDYEKQGFNLQGLHFFRKIPSSQILTAKG